MKYNSSIKDSIELLEKANIVADSHLNTVIPDNIGSLMRNLSYKNQWKELQRNYWYHIRLEDSSIIYFRDNSFNYFMTPFRSISMEEYLDKNLGREWREEEDNYTSEYSNEYELFVESESQESNPTPIRFDNHPKQYKNIAHPVCHLHFGHDNQIRLGTKKVMTPFSFCSFILRHHYPENWKSLIENEPQYFESILPKIKIGLELVTKSHPDKWCPVYEETTFYLS